MPNWCNNFVELTHDDPKMIARAVNATDNLFNEFVPCPEELNDGELTTSYGDEAKQKVVEAKKALMQKKYGYTSWYDWNIANWGTKWDACEVSVQSNSANSVSLSFDTAWSPPIAFYEQMLNLGFGVKAYYFEGGMCFAGKWEDGEDECYQDWGDSQGARDILPQDLDEMFAISESMAEYEEEERMEEELYAFVKEGAEARKEGAE